MLSNYRTRTILALPIVEKDNCIGVLQCINKFNGKGVLIKNLIRYIYEGGWVAIVSVRGFNEYGAKKYNKAQRVIISTEQIPNSIEIV